MGYRTLLIDPEGLLYTRPSQDTYLYAYLENLGIKPRHPQITQRALKAAQFDVMHGRIERDSFYDAILRFHGVQERDLGTGRSVVLKDRLSATAMLGAAEVIETLVGANFKLVIVTNTEHSSRDILQMLEGIGFPNTWWERAIASAEVKQALPDALFFEKALSLIEANPIETAYVTANTSHLPRRTEHSVDIIAYRITRESAPASHYVQSLMELVTLVKASKPL